MVYEEESGDITMSFTGDSLISRRTTMYREPKFLELVERLRASDVAFTNAETLFHRFESPPIPEAGFYGTYASCDPATIEDLKWLGIDMVSTANNHCFDYGEGGIVANLKYLDEYGMPHAGTGASLTEAAAPGYLDTPKGSIALVAVTLTMPAMDHRAGDARGPTKARPGANVLRQTVTCTVPPSTFETIRDTIRALGVGRPIAADATEMSFGGQRFVIGDELSKHATPHPHDWDLNLRWIAEARRMAEWVVVSMHNHTGGATADDPAQMSIDFAHAAIDTGADAVFGHGPHIDRGIEIYRGRPIFYSLATLFLHNDLIKWEPDEMYLKYDMAPTATAGEAYALRSHGDTRVDPRQFCSTVAEARFENKELVEVTLVPIDLGFYTGNRRMRGRPVVAEGDVARSILERLVRLSEPFGTKITIEGERGVIAVA